VIDLCRSRGRREAKVNARVGRGSPSFQCCAQKNQHRYQGSSVEQAAHPGTAGTPAALQNSLKVP
jgi:hypothetical protein